MTGAPLPPPEPGTPSQTPALKSVGIVGSLLGAGAVAHGFIGLLTKPDFAWTEDWNSVTGYFVALLFIGGVFWGTARRRDVITGFKVFDE